MKLYLLGIITTIVVLAGIAYFYLSLGFLNTRADISPSNFESKYAMKFLDASVDRHAPAGESPVQPTEANLMDGMHLYQDNCAMCHASPQHPEKEFGHPFYPPVPDFLEEAPDMEENRTFTSSSMEFAGARCRLGERLCRTSRSGPWSRS